MDPYMALMGQIPDDEQQRQIANALRGQAVTGGRLSTSTIAPVAKQGQALQGMAQDAAQGIGNARYRSQMIEEYGKDREASILKAALASRAKAAGAENKNRFHSMSGSRADKLYADTEKASTIMALGQALPRDFNSTGIPLWGTLKEKVANVAPILTSENVERDVDTWRQWNMEYNNILRNGIFGSALTTHEAAAWRAASINPNMDPEQIEQNTDNISRIIQHKAARKALSLINEDRDPQWLYDTYSDVLPDEFWEDPRGWTSQARQRVTGIGSKKSSSLEGLSDEELDRLISEAGG